MAGAARDGGRADPDRALDAQLGDGAPGGVPGEPRGAAGAGRGDAAHLGRGRRIATAPRAPRRRAGHRRVGAGAAPPPRPGTGSGAGVRETSERERRRDCTHRRVAWSSPRGKLFGAVETDPAPRTPDPGPRTPGPQPSGKPSLAVSPSRGTLPGWRVPWATSASRAGSRSRRGTGSPGTRRSAGFPTATRGWSRWCCGPSVSTPPTWSATTRRSSAWWGASSSATTTPCCWRPTTRSARRSRRLPSGSC